MIIFLPVLILLLTALALFILRFTRPNFRYPWMIAALGSILAIAGMLVWQIRFPHRLSLMPWQPAIIYRYSPTWLADGFSWPYALALASLAAAIIWTSVVRNESEPASWAGLLLLTGLGILAVCAGDPLTLVLAWSAIDITELIIMLRSTEGERETEGVVIAFAVRQVGTGLVVLAGVISIASNAPMDFQFVPARAGIYLLIAAGLRLGVLPLHLPYRKENTLRRGLGTALRLVSAAASLALLARIPAAGLQSPLLPYLLILAAIAAIYAGWMWLRSSDEILGRPFWVLGLAALAVAASLRGNPAGSVAWGVAAILSGGTLFLFSARQRRILWLPILGLWAISGLPFSPSAIAWRAGNTLSWLYALPFLPAQALLMAGYIRHTLHPGETSLESQEGWARAIYPFGLFLLVGISILLGLWGWDGARTPGTFWQPIAALALAIAATLLALKYMAKLSPGGSSGQWIRLLRLGWLYTSLAAIFRFLRKLTEGVTSMFEGEGGLLWSFLLLVLILSILSTQGR